MAHFIFSDGLKLRQKVRAVIASQRGEMLLVRPHGYRAGEWTLAGGGVEEGETPDQAIARELAEELGLTSWLGLRRLQTGNRFIYSPEYRAKRSLDHDGQDAVMYAVEVEPSSPLHLQASEIADAMWFPRNEALAALPVHAQRVVLEACLNEIDGQMANAIEMPSATGGRGRETRAA